MITRRPVGQDVPNWTPRKRPKAAVLDGTYVRLEPLSKKHASALHKANCKDTEHNIWTYLPYGPYGSSRSYGAWVEEMAGLKDPFFYAIYDKETASFGGVASYLRIKPADGSIEVGHINFAPRLQKSKAATEAIFRMMEWAFEAGYRRFEWKCDALNAGSINAAKRYGFVYEGTFRQATIYKNRNRDTAWFAIIDKDWPPLREAFETWLDPSNFDKEGRQIKRLSALTAFMAGK